MTDQMVTVPKLKLSTGNEIPQIGLGLWKITDEAVFKQTFTTAIAAGYRHFDCAQAYGNERFLGQCLKDSGLSRADVFITTKIDVRNFGHQKTHDSFKISLGKLQTDYVDLVLLHFPGLPWKRKPSWKALEEIKASGQARSIGVSNYKIKHLKAMQHYAKEQPATNQVEMHVFLQQKEMLQYCVEHRIQVEAYSPLAHAQALSEPIIQAIADRYSKTYAQIMLRWCVEQGTVPLPKSTTPERIQSNIDIFDFALDAEDMQQLATLDRGMRTVWRSIFINKN